MTESTTNRDRLMLTAIDLMAEKGYQGVSTKEIAAAAGVSEMTLFRQFGTKLQLLEQAIGCFHYAGEMEKLFSTRLTWSLREDLLQITRAYHDIMNRNRKLVLVMLRSAELSDLRDRAQDHPRQLQQLLTAYFQEMHRQGKVKAIDSEAQAMTFMWMNYGAFISRLHNADLITAVSHEQFLQTSIELFVDALTPMNERITDR
ncbi:AcrR family transcriptional regulator [Paenibacillus rhizosphaerae]|uniref:AcrR family transcriptional regulator n=1 Tax=Paenibacillus rhizosphaerae TaxID=297318 RepID=A0A839TVX7_9BACL|nr:TetR/AcrR family transcriptional regulator [Paenibacillus rhizosphaerae]MBB3130653.1 AcrR family transcriptional regulator [Paenibacillus rhizosphaerae]